MKIFQALAATPTVCVTLKELRENLRKAISFHLEGLKSLTP